jgi:hypothetical protein
VNADVSATRLDVALEIVLLCGVEYVTGCGHEDYRAVTREILRGEGPGVFGRVDGESVLLSKFPDGGDADRNRAMSIASGLGEDEYPSFLTVDGDRSGKRT